MPGDLKTSRYQKPTKEVKRSEIIAATYNPRIIDAGSAKRLREGMQRFGLVDTLTWNESTKTLVGGHKRLDQLDKLEGFDPDDPDSDYLVTVTVVNHEDVKDEKALNVLLNNRSIQGNDDTDAIYQMLTEGEFNPFEAGLSELDLEMDYGADLLEEMQTMWLEEEEQTISPGASSSGGGDQTVLEDAQDSIDQIKAAKREQVAADQGDADAQHVLHVVYRNRAELEEALTWWGFERNKRYIDITTFDDVMTEAYKEVLEPDIVAEALNKLEPLLLAEKKKLTKTKLEEIFQSLIGMYEVEEE